MVSVSISKKFWKKKNIVRTRNKQSFFFHFFMISVQSSSSHKYTRGVVKAKGTVFISNCFLFFVRSFICLSIFGIWHWVLQIVNTIPNPALTNQHFKCQSCSFSYLFGFYTLRLICKYTSMMLQMFCAPPCPTFRVPCVEFNVQFYMLLSSEQKRQHSFYSNTKQVNGMEIFRSSAIAN